jgi:hypothetical protein
MRGDKMNGQYFRRAKMGTCRKTDSSRRQLTHSYTTGVSIGSFILRETTFYKLTLCTVRQRRHNILQRWVIFQQSKGTDVDEFDWCHASDLFSACGRCCVFVVTGYAVIFGRNQRWHFLQLQQKTRLILKNVVWFGGNCKGDLYDLRASKVKYGEASNVTSALVAILRPICQSVWLPDCHASRTSDWFSHSGQLKRKRSLFSYMLSVPRL